MATDKSTGQKRIVVTRNGPYIVEGGIPLVAKIQVVSEHGEPLSWHKQGEVAAIDGEYHLCRCGKSSDKPFCDGTHCRVNFDGTEAADTNLTEARAVSYPRGTGILVTKDAALCMQAGHCGLLNMGMRQLVAATQDTKIRSLVMAMVERCPSGALSYRLEAGGPIIEPDLPQQVAITTEITSDGPIAGPLWVTGGIPVERADGQPFETRHRVTLCNCGQSGCKPLCDGTHRTVAAEEARRRRAGEG
jgi:CDGSH-type Zn-finger protein